MSVLILVLISMWSIKEVSKNIDEKRPSIIQNADQSYTLKMKVGSGTSYVSKNKEVLELASSRICNKGFVFISEENIKEDTNFFQSDKNDIVWKIKCN